MMTKHPSALSSTPAQDKQIGMQVHSSLPISAPTPHFKPNATLNEMYSSYKHSPHSPSSLLLKYAIHRSENADAYSAAKPDQQKMMDQAFLNHHQQGNAAKKIGHITTDSLSAGLAQNPHIVPQLLAHQRSLHDTIIQHAPKAVDQLNGTPHLRLARNMNITPSQRGDDHALYSMADKTQGQFGQHEHHQHVPLKNVWFSYELGHPDTDPAGHGHEDEFIVSPHKNVPRDDSKFPTKDIVNSDFGAPHAHGADAAPYMAKHKDYKPTEINAMMNHPKWGVKKMLLSHPGADESTVQMGLKDPDRNVSKWAGEMAKRKGIINKSEDLEKVTLSSDVTVTNPETTGFENLPDGIHDNGRNQLVYKTGGNVVGSINFTEHRAKENKSKKFEDSSVPVEDTSRIDSIWVHPDYRNAGIANKMLTHAINTHKAVESNLTANEGGNNVWKGLAKNPNINLKLSSDPDYGHIAWVKQPNISFGKSEQREVAIETMVNLGWPKPSEELFKSAEKNQPQNKKYKPVMVCLSFQDIYDFIVDSLESSSTKELTDKIKKLQHIKIDIESFISEHAGDFLGFAGSDFLFTLPPSEKSELYDFMSKLETKYTINVVAGIGQDLEQAVLAVMSNTKHNRKVTEAMAKAEYLEKSIVNQQYIRDYLKGTRSFNNADDDIVDDALGHNGQWHLKSVPAKSLKMQYGFGDINSMSTSRTEGPIVVNSRGVIVDGNHRLAEALRNNHENIDAWVPHIPNKAMAKAEDNFKVLDLVHFSRHPDLQSLDPSFQFTGQAGKEKTRIQQSREYLNHAVPGFKPANYLHTYGSNGEDAEPMFNNLSRYHIQVKDKDIYDLSKDPDKVFAKVKDKHKEHYGPSEHALNHPDLVHNELKSMGYKGWKASGHESPTFANSVMLYDKIPVKNQHTSDLSAVKMLPSGKSTKI